MPTLRPYRGPWTQEEIEANFRYVQERNERNRAYQQYIEECKAKGIDFRPNFMNVCEKTKELTDIKEENIPSIIKEVLSEPQDAYDYISSITLNRIDQHTFKVRVLRKQTFPEM